MHRIAVINNWLISGGAEKQGLILAKTLNKRYKVFLYVYYSDKIEEKFLKVVELNNIELILLKGSHLNKFYTFYKSCKKNKISIIISYLFAGNVLNGFVGSFLNIKHRIGGIRNSRHSTIKNFVQRIIHNNFLTLSVSNSYKGMEECVGSGYNHLKMLVIHNCFEFKTENFKTEVSDEVKIITVARFVEQKDFLTSIKAIHHALSKLENKKIRYIILGYGKLENKIKEWINDYEINDIVTLIINPPNVNEYLSRSDIYLSTSLFEGLSNSIMEAMSHSLPIIATNVGDNSYLVKNNHNGYLTEIGDHVKLGGYIAELTNDSGKRLEFGRESYQLLKENFSSEKFEHNYLSVINNLVEIIR
jgi:glycosyltransferase involved in cell wall biosynthesis